MKHLLYVAILILASCSKKEQLTETNSKTIFYKIQEVDNDGKTFESPIKRIDMDFIETIVRDNGHNHEGDDDDDDDDDDNPVPIKIETISLTKNGSNSVKIYWEAENEDNVNYYSIERSFDLTNWKSISIKEKLRGKYTHIDKL
jgi:hypothetical protein